MQNVMGVINLVNEEHQLDVLTHHRCLASVPFGGRYRLIDFILSSFVNSGIHNVSVFVHSKYRSLMDHLGSGKEWNLDRKRNGLFLFTPGNDEVKEIIKGDLYQFYYQMDYFYRSTQEYVVLTRSHMVCNIDFRDVLQTHIEKKADITMVYKNIGSQTQTDSRKIKLDRQGMVIDMREPQGRLDSGLVSLEIFVMRKALFIRLVEKFLAKGYDNFVRDAIMKSTDELNIAGYEYKGYLGVVNTLQSYYANSMKLLDANVWKQLFYEPDFIYTKIKDEPPTRYKGDSEVSHSLIANGCVIEGKVENCILFRGVKVAKGAHIKNSIIMQNTVIHENANLNTAIIDKDAVIHKDKVLSGDKLAPFTVLKRQEIF